MSKFSEYDPTPEGYDRQMTYLLEIWKTDSGRQPEDVGDNFGRYITQHLMLACKKDGQEECPWILAVNEENYWKQIYQDWLPEHHMRIVACGMLQLCELRPASHAAAITRILTDLDRYLNTRENRVDVPHWTRIMIQMQK